MIINNNNSFVIKVSDMEEQYTIEMMEIDEHHDVKPAEEREEEEGEVVQQVKKPQVHQPIVQQPFKAHQHQPTAPNVPKVQHSRDRLLHVHQPNDYQPNVQLLQVHQPKVQQPNDHQPKVRQPNDLLLLLESGYSCELCDHASPTALGLREHVARRHLKTVKVMVSSSSTASTASTASSKSGRHYRLSSQNFSPVASAGRNLPLKRAPSEDEEGPLVVCQSHAEKSSSSGRKVYRCARCAYTALSAGALYIHDKVVHRGAGEKCDRCDYVGGTKALLRSHVDAVHMGLKQGCDRCDYIGSAGAVYNHKKARHEKRVVRCGDCGFATVYKQALDKHVMLRHKGRVFGCNMCDFRGSMEEVRQHRRAVHYLLPARFKEKVIKDKVFKEEAFKDKVFKDEVFKDKAFKEKVIKDMVIKDKVFKDKAFKEKVFKDKVFKDKVFKHDLSNNRESAEEAMVHKRHACELCTFETGRRADLKRHMVVRHMDVRYRCGRCPFKAGRMGELKRHVEERHTEQEVEEEEEDKEEEGEEKRHSCEECGLMTADLRRHMESAHVGVGYTCDRCDFRTGVRSELGRHLAEGGSVGVSFTCDLCPTAFCRVKDLVRHNVDSHRVVGGEF